MPSQRWLDMTEWLSGGESACSAEDMGSILGVGGDPLEEGMATHSTLLAWSIPWTEEPFGLHQYMESQKSQTRVID